MAIQRSDFRKEFFTAIMTLQQRAQLPNRGAIQFIESGFLSALSDVNRSIKCTNCGKLTKECSRGFWVRSYLLPWKGSCAGTSPLTFPYERPPFERWKVGTCHYARTFCHELSPSSFRDWSCPGEWYRYTKKLSQVGSNAADGRLRRGQVARHLPLALITI